MRSGCGERDGVVIEPVLRERGPRVVGDLPRSGDGGQDKAMRRRASALLSSTCDIRAGWRAPQQVDRPAGRARVGQAFCLERYRWRAASPEVPISDPMVRQE